MLLRDLLSIPRLDPVPVLRTKAFTGCWMEISAPWYMDVSIRVYITRKIVSVLGGRERGRVRQRMKLDSNVA